MKEIITLLLLILFKTGVVSAIEIKDTVTYSKIKFSPEISNPNGSARFYHNKDSTFLFTNIGFNINNYMYEYHLLKSDSQYSWEEILFIDSLKTANSVDTHIENDSCYLVEIGKSAVCLSLDGGDSWQMRSREYYDEYLKSIKQNSKYYYSQNDRVKSFLCVK